MDKWPAAALPQSKATLQQGLPLRAERGAAGQFWTFTMSNSKASTFAETMNFGAEPRMHATFTRAASGAALASEASGQRGHSMMRAPDTRPEPGSSARAASPRSPPRSRTRVRSRTMRVA